WPQQPAVAIDDDRRALARRREIERAEACRVARPGARRAEPCRSEECKHGGDDEGEARKARHSAPSFGETLIRRASGAPPSPQGRRGSDGIGWRTPSPQGKRRSAPLLPRG